MPALRLGAIVADADCLAQLVMAKRNQDLTSSLVLQRALATYLRRGHLGVHLQRARSLYSERRDAMLTALERHTKDCMWTKPAGGLSLWLTIPAGVDESEVYHELLRRGVGVSRGQAFYPQPQATGHLRLSFGAQPADLIEQGIGIIATVITEQLKQRALIATRAQREMSPLV
ncbi:MAG TPA: aminotransferase class I/II-fold pyridoxal phosphate-dependent enzyme, partial [Ktedonobacterales bacterium]|nr:aminotransferase class I/II-fold pyridoxal phosphate-dependent enzyme [Ktedonobacterales bacterium]